MKKTITRLSSLSVVALMLFAACDSRHAAQPADSDADTTITEAIADSSVYGIVGEGTAMHTLEVITDVGDTLEFVLADADTDVPTVLGGLLAGDRVAVVSHTADGDRWLTRLSTSHRFWANGPASTRVSKFAKEASWSRL